MLVLVLKSGMPAGSKHDAVVEIRWGEQRASRWISGGGGGSSERNPLTGKCKTVSKNQEVPDHLTAPCPDE